MRLDLFLAQGQNFTRNKAQQLISAGLVSVNGKSITKPAFEVSETDSINIQEDRRVRWVSRSAEKLAGFLLPPCEGGMSERQGGFALKIQILGTNCLDVGASTGGFTQVLLELGAAHVDAVDVGTDQLHESLRNDPRVTSYEQTDIREFAITSLSREDVTQWQEGLAPKTSDIKTPLNPLLRHNSSPKSGKLKTLTGGSRYDLIVCDASFISLHEILPSMLDLTDEQTNIILLYKPQFEVGRENLRKTGVPKDEKIVEKKLTEFEQFLTEQNCQIIARGKSTLIGEAGNQEWVYWIKKAKAQLKG
jgi:23S rRNA (cytidine1920-2'-O)/16S rRNA (cytidine1409-2'-O)-methyltransferase